MSTYVIGDVQGCFDSLSALVERIGADPRRDRLWIAGDLVNRGPKNLDVLRWVAANQHWVDSVLGNHDLHLLARAAGLAQRKRRDTLGDVLAAPDRAELVDWLRRRPLLHRDGAHVIVHAGLHPAWTVGEAEMLAREIEAGLASDDWPACLARLRTAAPPWSAALTGAERLAAATAVLVHMRTLRADGSLCADFSGAPADAPPGCVPWFAAPGRRWTGVVVAGHWSALGLTQGEHFIALDSGCVWGRALTAVRLDDGRIYQVPAQEAAPGA